MQEGKRTQERRGMVGGDEANAAKFSSPRGKGDPEHPLALAWLPFCGVHICLASLPQSRATYRMPDRRRGVVQRSTPGALFTRITISCGRRLAEGKPAKVTVTLHVPHTPIDIPTSSLLVEIRTVVGSVLLQPCSHAFKSQRHARVVAAK